MTRGCEKRIIHIKDTDSDVFEEAYFVLRPGVTAYGKTHEAEMVKEAGKLIKASLPFAYPSAAKRRRRAIFRTVFVIFLFLASAAISITLAVFLIGLV